jgi:hypothetical protein
MATFNELKAVKRRHAAALLRKTGVCGVAIDQDSDGTLVIAVHLESDDPGVREQLPTELEGHPVKFVHTGPIRKQRAKRSRTPRRSS